MSKNIDFNDLVSYQDAAKLVGKSVITIKRWARTGIIKKYPITKQSVFVKKSELLKKIESSAI